MLDASADAFVLVNVVTSCFIIGCDILVLLLFLLLPLLLVAVADAARGGLGDLPFLLFPVLIDCCPFFVFRFESTEIVSESSALLSLNILFARAEVFSALLKFCIKIEWGQVENRKPKFFDKLY